MSKCFSGVVDRDAIDRDSTAVLAFGDGTRIPCDRFIVRTFCSVLGKLMDDFSDAGEVDHRGRTVLPMPGQDPGAYWVAMDLLHGARAPWQLGLADLGLVLRALEFLGTTAYDAALDAQLWLLLRGGGEPLDVVMEHAPRLLRNATIAPGLVRRLIKLRWKWSDFARDVLARLEPVADATMVGAVMLYAPNFFPPALVLDWCLRACPHLTKATALRLASLHGVMYHPVEITGVLRRLADVCDAHGWDVSSTLGTALLPGTGGLAPLLRMATAALEKYDTVPWSAHKVHGSQVKFHDVNTASMCVTLESSTRFPKKIKLSPWLHSTHADGLQLRFRPRAIDSTSAACTSLQLRAMAFDTHDPLCATATAEAWFLYEDIEEDSWLALHDATSQEGDVPLFFDLLRTSAARLLRLDFFFGPRSVLDNPYDVNPAS